MLNDDVAAKIDQRSPLHKFYRFTRVSGVCGVEVEVEFTRLNQIPPADMLDWWKVQNDGSLRHIGVEYTLHKPLTGISKSKAVVAVCDFINKNPFVQDSPRTSVHVHINVQKRTPIEIWNAATVYWILEPILMEFCGGERVGNPFCLRMIDALNLVDVCCDDLRQELPFARFRNNDEIRYAGLNLQPLRSFGSMEFRGMRGVYEPAIINPWSDMLVRLVNVAAAMWPNPEAILDEVYNTGRTAFAKKVLGPYYDEMFKPFYTKDTEDGVELAIEAILPFAYFHDWNKWQDKMEANLVKNKDKLEQLLRGRGPAIRRGDQFFGVVNVAEAVQPGVVLDPLEALHRLDELNAFDEANRAFNNPPRR